MRRLDLGLLAPALLGFWACYFTLVALTNATDLLRALGVLPPSFPWVAGNLAFIAQSIGRVGVPAGLSPWLLAGVMAWEGLAAALFGAAARRDPGDDALGPPFVVSLGLWAVFILLDELLIIFETGVEATHLRLFLTELATLLVIRQLRPAGPAPQRSRRPR
jgi:hypothetical protein